MGTTLEERVATVEGRLWGQSAMLARIQDDIAQLRQQAAAGFAAVDQRFLALEQRVDGRCGLIDVRLTALDQRLSSVDQRFSSIDRHFSSIDQRFSSIDQRFSSIDQQFSTQDEKRGRDFRWLVGTMVTMTAAIMAAVLTR